MGLWRRGEDNGIGTLLKCQCRCSRRCKLLLIGCVAVGGADRLIRLRKPAAIGVAEGKKPGVIPLDAASGCARASTEDQRGRDTLNFRTR